VTPSRADLQKIGNEMRRFEGPAALAKRTLAKIEASKDKLAIVDGFRNPHEVAHFRQHTKFYLLAIDAPIELRFKRAVERQRPGDPRTLAEFLSLDARDRGEGEPEDGQQVGACLRLADVAIQNDETLLDLKGKVDALLRQIRGNAPSG
jgi:dephospho-CoA kinase